MIEFLRLAFVAAATQFRSAFFGIQRVVAVKEAEKGAGGSRRGVHKTRKAGKYAPQSVHEIMASKVKKHYDDLERQNAASGKKIGSAADAKQGLDGVAQDKPESMVERKSEVKPDITKPQKLKVETQQSEKQEFEELPPQQGHQTPLLQNQIIEEKNPNQPRIKKQNVVDNQIHSDINKIQNDQSEMRKGETEKPTTEKPNGLQPAEQQFAKDQPCRAALGSVVTFPVGSSSERATVEVCEACESLSLHENCDCPPGKVAPRLGEGTYGDVYRCRLKITTGGKNPKTLNKWVALKLVLQKGVCGEQRAWNFFSISPDKNTPDLYAADLLNICPRKELDLRKKLAALKDEASHSLQQRAKNTNILYSCLSISADELAGISTKKDDADCPIVRLIPFSLLPSRRTDQLQSPKLAESRGKRIGMVTELLGGTELYEWYEPFVESDSRSSLLDGSRTVHLKPAPVFAPRDFESYSYAEATQIALDILHGLKLMHEAGTAHCDLKPENVRFRWGPEDEPYEGTIVRIIDLGGLVTLGPEVNEACYTKDYNTNTKVALGTEYFLAHRPFNWFKEHESCHESDGFSKKHAEVRKLQVV